MSASAVSANERLQRTPLPDNHEESQTTRRRDDADWLGKGTIGATDNPRGNELRLGSILREFNSKSPHPTV